MRFYCIQSLVVFALLIGGQETQPTTAQVEKKPQTNSSSKEQKKRKQTIALSKAEVIGFIREHHPELEELLITLEKSRPDRYNAAIRNLSRSIVRIQKLKDEESDKYNGALRQWKIKSRIHLAAVQLGVEESPQHREQLEKLIVQNVDHRKRQLELEAKRLRKRLANIEKQLNVIEQKRDQEIEKQMLAADELVNRVRASRPRKANPNKNARQKKDK